MYYGLSDKELEEEREADFLGISIKPYREQKAIEDEAKRKVRDEEEEEYANEEKTYKELFGKGEKEELDEKEKKKIWAKILKKREEREKQAFAEVFERYKKKYEEEKEEKRKIKEAGGLAEYQKKREEEAREKVRQYQKQIEEEKKQKAIARAKELTEKYGTFFSIDGNFCSINNDYENTYFLATNTKHTKVGDIVTLIEVDPFTQKDTGWVLKAKIVKYEYNKVAEEDGYPAWKIYVTKVAEVDRPAWWKNITKESKNDD